MFGVRRDIGLYLQLLPRQSLSLMRPISILTPNSEVLTQGMPASHDPNVILNG